RVHAPGLLHSEGRDPMTFDDHILAADDDQAAAPTTTNVGGIAGERLLSIVERWERLEEEKKALASDQKDILTEAKSAGFDCKIVRQLFRLRRMEANELQEADALLELYRRAVGL
ncbi:MAG: DUF2312 domain-containing protein, partial [Janthinobacterium lividum]